MLTAPPVRPVDHRRAVLGLAVTAGLAGCGLRDPDGSESPRSTGPTLTPADGAATRTTHLRASGNRLVAGRGSVPSAEPLDVPLGLDAAPAWVVAVPAAGGDASVWAVADRAGDVAAWRVDDDGATRTDLSATLAPGQPPVLGRDSAGVGLPPLPDDLSPLSHPVALPSGGRAYVSADGALVLRHDGQRQRLDVAAPPDAYPAVASAASATPTAPGSDPRVVVLAGATDRYGHGALGDRIEADGFAVVDPAAGTVETRVSLPGPAVVEGQAPILADLTGDGRPEVVLTAADAERGARIVAYSLSGARVAAGPAVGSGFRWRHQCAVAPFAPDGRAEVAAVETPHIGGTVEFYRREEDRLRIVGRVAGASSHALGSRTLDGAVAADADGDSRVELVVPDDVRRTLLGVRRTANGATVAWRAPVGGQLASNLHAVAVDGRLVVGVARHDGVLRLWR
jgi:hypothetical protein